MIFQGKKLSQIDPIEASKLTAEHGYIVIEDSGATPKEFAEWSLEYGYHVSPDIWCTDKEHSEYFWRVSNDKVDGENPGLFGDCDEIGWHCNLIPNIDAQEIVGVMGKTITYDTSTWVCSSIPYWKTLTDADKELFEKLYILTIDGTDKKPMMPHWMPQGWTSDKVNDDIKKNREVSEIKFATNLEEQYKDKVVPARGKYGKFKLVPNHPLGIKGIFFQPWEIVDFVYEDGTIYEHSKELFDTLWNDWVESGKYTYKCNWKEGTIFLKDQLTTLHKRPPIQPSKPRELLRVACWYKGEVRNHWEHTL